jgi:hypothetical protein
VVTGSGASKDLGTQFKNFLFYLGSSRVDLNFLGKSMGYQGKEITAALQEILDFVAGNPLPDVRLDLVLGFL